MISYMLQWRNVWFNSNQALYLVKKMLIENAIFRKFTVSRFHVRGSPALTTEDGSFELTSRGLMEGINMEKSSQGCYKAMQLSQ